MTNMRYAHKGNCQSDTGILSDDADNDDNFQTDNGDEVVITHLTKAIAGLSLEILSEDADSDDNFQTGNGDDVVSRLHLNRHFVCSTHTSQQQLQVCGDLKGFPNPIKLPPMLPPMMMKLVLVLAMLMLAMGGVTHLNRHFFCLTTLYNSKAVASLWRIERFSQRHNGTRGVMMMKVR